MNRYFKRSHLKVGQWGEKKAELYLKKQGYRIISKNWRCKLGEIDLIAETKNTLTFVEVKTRKLSHADQYPTYFAVHKRKSAKIVTLSRIFLGGTRKYSDYSIRFDIICVEYESDQHVIKHYQDAWRPA